MLKNIKKLKELEKAALHSNFSHYDESGAVVVEMNVNNPDEFFSPFYGKDKIISEEAAAFLENRVRAVDVKRDLKIEIVASGDKEEYGKAVKNYYRDKFLESRRKSRNLLLASVVMALLAVLIFSLSITLGILELGTVALEVIDIVGGVFMWEAVDIFFFQRKHNLFEAQKCAMLYNSEIIIKNSNGENNNE